MTLAHHLPRALIHSALALAAIPAALLIAGCLLYCAMLGKAAAWVAR